MQEKQHIHYVYVTTNLINGKQYVGDHTINPKEKYYYLGSGNAFRHAVSIYGEYLFFKEILEWFLTRKEAFDAQEKYIKQFNTISPMGYNISPTGGMYKNTITHFSEEHRKHLKESHMGQIAWNRNIPASEESKIKNRNSHMGISSGNKNGMYGKTVYEIWIEKYGEIIAHQKEIELYLKLSNSRKGKKHSEEHLKNLKIAAKNRKKQEKKKGEHCSKLIALSWYDKYHGDKCKFKN